MLVKTPSASYSITLRAEIVNKVGMLGKVTSAIGQAGGDIGAIDLVEATAGKVIRDFIIKARDEAHEQEIVEAVNKVKDVRVITVTDRTFDIHHGGKITVQSKIPVKTRDDLSMAYTPGVARVCMAIHNKVDLAYDYTIKSNTVAVVSDGTAVLGLGDIGPEAAMPVMEGKALLFKEFAGVDAFPICVSSKNVDDIVNTVKFIAPAFGGINLEDISAPRCFEIEERLKKEIDIPVFHDDQHGTACVVLAALINSLKIVKKKPEDIKVVFSGVGASGVATAKILMAFGVKEVIGCDTKGAVYKGRKENMNFMKEWFAAHTNPKGIKGPISEAIKGADVFIGLSVPKVINVEDVRSMAKDPVVFAMANPIPEIYPEEAGEYVKVMATGRSDYPNQINNVLGFPGIFRGLLDCRAREINDEMKIAAAKGIASIISSSELNEDYIIPSVFNKKVVEMVAGEIVKAAVKTGVARKIVKFAK